MRNAKATFIKNKLASSVDDPRKFWKSINCLLKGPKSEHLAQECINSATGEVILKENICDFLNEYYANIGRANLVAETLKPNWNKEDPGFQFDVVTLREVTELVKDIDIGKDSCIEGISTHILKNGLSVLIKQLQHLFNVSLEESVFPREWAKGFINILPKGGNLKDPSNWRPITQALLPAKMLEKLVQRRLYNILCMSNYISESQYGFMPGRSTQEAIFEILKEIHDSRNSKRITGLLFLDVKKAFDSLDHNILLGKLQTLGLGGKLLEWFCSYLDRVQCVRHNGMTSQDTIFKCGIPQGSCLGPTLFIFYINSVFTNVNRNVNMMMFADDCVLYKSHESCNYVLEKLQIGLNEYVEWGLANNMHLDASKTKAMLMFPTVQYNLYRPLCTAGREIQYVHNFNYLGVIIDDQIRFSAYYHLIKRRVEHKIFVLSKIRKYVNTKTAVLIYKQAILPLMEYAGFVLISCSIKQRRELQTLQNNALRVCKRYYLRDRIRIDNLHRECNILGLEQRRRKQLLRLMYLHSKKEQNVKKPVRLTRAITKIIFSTPAKCTRKYLNSPFSKGTLLWNVLDANVQRIANVLQFVSSLRKIYTRYEETW